MAALLTSVLDSQDKVAEYITECRENGIALLPPDINESETAFTVSGENIRFGLGDAVGLAAGYAPLGVAVDEGLPLPLHVLLLLFAHGGDDRGGGGPQAQEH